MRRGKEMRQLTAEVLDAAGVTGYVFGPTRSGHQKVSFVLGGRERTMFFPSTPGDKRAMMNQRCLVRMGYTARPRTWSWSLVTAPLRYYLDVAQAT